MTLATHAIARSLGRLLLIEGFLLGLSTGASCLAFCTPVLLPYYFGEGGTVRQNVPLLGWFLLGRLVGYLLFGALAWLAGWHLLGGLPGREWLFGVATVLLAALLIGYGFGFFRGRCAAEAASGRMLERLQRLWLPLPLWLGLLTGLSLCPPFLLALSTAARTTSLWYSMLFFLAFFLGTSLYLVPLPLAGSLRRVHALQPVGRLTAGVIGCYYLYTGLMMTIKGRLS